MSSSPRRPPNNPPAVAVRRRVMLAATIGFLILSALVILVVPLRLPLAVRLGVVFTDLIAAAVIGLLLRQSTPR